MNIPIVLLDFFIIFLINVLFVLSIRICSRIKRYDIDRTKVLVVGSVTFFFEIAFIYQQNQAFYIPNLKTGFYCFQCLFPTMLFFLGPLHVLLKHRRLHSLYTRLYEWVISHEFWEFIKIYIMCPLSEEIVFRQIIHSILQKHFTNSASALISGFIFGISHIHHVLDDQTIQTTIFQVCYSTIFGIYESYLYNKTNSLLGIILVHSFCNMVGFPDLSILNQTRYIVSHSIGISLFLIHIYIYL